MIKLKASYTGVLFFRSKDDVLKHITSLLDSATFPKMGFDIEVKEVVEGEYEYECMSYAERKEYLSLAHYLAGCKRGEFQKSLEGEYDSLGDNKEYKYLADFLKAKGVYDEYYKITPTVRKPVVPDNVEF